MRWRVRKLRPKDRYDRDMIIDDRHWVSYPIGSAVDLRRHHTHREALDRAFRRAYGR